MNEQSTTTTDFNPFPSLSALRTAHNALLDAHREEGDTDAFWQAVAHFLQRGRSTGALLDREDDHWAAQSLLDYWSATGYSTGREMPDAVLDEFDPSLAPEIPDDQCPYVGLSAFREGQRPYFFGRQQLVETLTAKLQSERLLAVVGPSGSGKSSVVLAGLIPTLKHGAIDAQDGAPASDQWRYSRRMVPGSDPLVNLEQAILPGVDSAPTTVALATKFAFAADGFRREPDYLLKLINETGDVPFVLIIDQFEEIFTLCTDETLRQAFIDNLLTLIDGSGSTPNRRHTVILTMRTDFESFVARLPDFQPRFEEAIVRVTPLNAAELRSVIEQPAALVGLKFEEGVVDALVQDVLGEPAALPLLQFTLLKLWERRERNRITWESYKTSGGGRLALSRSADQLYESLIPEEQVTARRILLRLVRPGDGLEITSNRVRRSVLYQTGEARDRVDRVLNRLVEADLLRLSPGEKPEDTQIEVAHEALVRNWPRLVGWLEDERGRIRERLRLTEAAEQWLKLDRDPSALLRGTLLENAQRHPDLSELEEAYVQASRAAREAAAFEREAVRQRELEQARALAVEQQQRAEAERRSAEYQALAAAKLRQRAWLLALITVAALALAAVALLFWYRSEEARSNALTAQESAEAAEETAVAERVAALAALDEVRAEQTRVQHLQNAINFAAEQLDQTPTVTTLLTPNAIPGTSIPVTGTLVPIGPDSTLTLTPNSTPVPAVTPPSGGTVNSSDVDDTATPPAERTADGGEPTVEATATPSNGGDPATVNTPDVNVTDAITATSAATLTPTVSAPMTGTPTVISPPVVTDTNVITELLAIVPDIEIPIYAETSEKSEVLRTVRAPLRLPVLEADAFWVEVQLDGDYTGWIQAWLLTYQGDVSRLPLELQYLFVSEEVATQQRTDNLPFVYGVVISVDGAEGYDLLSAVARAEAVVTQVPVGTDVTLLRRAKDQPDPDVTWYFVNIVDPNGENQIWQGYLPGTVMQQR